MDKNKISIECNNCKYKKESSIRYRLSLIDGEDIGKFLMIVSGIILIILGYIYMLQVSGFLTATTSLCLLIFVIGMLMVLSSF